MPQAIQEIRQTIIIPEASRERFLPLTAACGAALFEQGVELAGLSGLTPGYCVARDGLDIHVVLGTLDGCGLLDAGGVRRRLDAGSLLIAPVGTAYRYDCEGDAWRIYWFHLADNARWRHLRGPVVLRPAYCMTETVAAMEGLLRESLRHDATAGRLAVLFAEQVLLYLDRELAPAGSDAGRRMQDRLHGLWHAVNLHPERSWSVQELAGAIHVSPPHLHRLTREHHGCSPQQMVFRLRMRRAEALLLQRDHLPLKTIAERIGYGTPFAFSNAFRRWRGTSPSEFRVAALQQRTAPEDNPET